MIPRSRLFPGCPVARAAAISSRACGTRAPSKRTGADPSVPGSSVRRNGVEHAKDEPVGLHTVELRLLAVRDMVDGETGDADQLAYQRRGVALVVAGDHERFVTLGWCARGAGSRRAARRSASAVVSSPPALRSRRDPVSSRRSVRAGADGCAR